MVVAAAALFSSLMSYVQQYIIATVGEELTLSLRQDVSAKLNRLPLRYFDGHKTGDIMSRVTNDLEKVSSVMQVGLMQLVSSVFTIALAAAAMVMLSPRLFLVVLVSLALSMTATGYVSALAQRAYGGNMAAMGALTGKVEELYAGNRVVKVFNRQAAMLEEAETLTEAQFRAQRRAQFADYAVYPAIRVLGQLGFIATAVLGGGMALGGTITLGAVQAFLQYVNQIAEPVTEASYVITSLQAAIAGAERVFALLDEEEERPEAAGDASAITQGHVEFRHVRFGYTPERTLIHDLNLEVRPNEMVAIVGPTGCGKTTLINLLMRWMAAPSPSTDRTSPPCPGGSCGGASAWCSRTPGSLRAPSQRTSPTAGGTPPGRRSWRRPGRPAATTSSAPCPRGTIPRFPGRPPACPRDRCSC